MVVGGLVRYRCLYEVRHRHKETQNMGIYITGAVLVVVFVVIVYERLSGSRRD